MVVHRILRAAERLRAVDGPAELLARRIQRVLGEGTADRLLRGRWLGHPVHPPLVTVPLGAWVCAAVFELRGERDLAWRLAKIGLVATPPAVVTGLAEFSRLDQVQRRVGVLHAVTNVLAAACFRVATLCDGDRSPRVWGLAGLTLVSAAGALGGHLSYALGAGVQRWPEATETPVAV